MAYELHSSAANVRPTPPHRPSYRPVARDFQIRFVAVVLAVLTIAAGVFGVINFLKEREFEIPSDGVWWVEHNGQVLAERVEANGPAAKAGIRATRRTPDGQIELGDLILAIDGQTLESADDLLSAQEKYKVGDTVTVLLLRDGQRREVKVTLAAAQ